MEQQVILVIAEVLGVEKEAIKEASIFEEIEGWESLTQVRMIAELEDAFTISIPIETALEMKSVKEYIDIVKGLCK